jgi:hypothetical protein
MMPGFDFIIYGNNIAALVSALQLGKKHKVALINPVPNWGAHFAGTVIDDIKYDVGMNFFEFTTFHPQSDDLLSYNPMIRNDSARFFHLVESFFYYRLPIVQVPEPKCCVMDAWEDDIIISNNFDILKKLPEEIQLNIKKELQAILDSGPNPLHARNKSTDEALFLQTDYKTVSVANHGQTFHDLFIEPICRKIFNLSSSQIPALFHRTAWAPLFYPETLLDAFAGKETFRSPTLFHYPREGYFAKAVEVLVGEIQQSSNISIITKKPKNLVFEDKTTIIDFEDGSISGNKLVWTSDLSTLLSLNGIKLDPYQSQKASLVLVFLQMDTKRLKKQFSTVYVCDMETCIYRATNQDYAAQTNNPTSRLVFEMNHDLLLEKGITDNEAIVKHVVDFLTSEEIITDAFSPDLFTVKVLKNSVNLPVRPNYYNFQKMHKLAAENCGVVELIGTASGFTSASFNDQVVQALKLEKKYC